MSDFKQKYSQALKMLDETEREGVENLNKIYRCIQAILSLLKGQHKQIDKAIKSLPKTINPSKLPLDTLDRIADLIVSHSSQNESNSPTVTVDALLDELETEAGWEEKVKSLNVKLHQAKDESGLAIFISEFADEIRAIGNIDSQQNSWVGDPFVGDYKETLFHLLNQLTADLAQSLDVVRTKKNISEASDFKKLGEVSKEVFTGFGKTLYKKNKFILELSGLIETVAYQLEEFSVDFKADGVSLETSTADRWRFTELVDNEVQSLAETVVKAENLESLKSVLTTRLKDLNKTVSDHVAVEEKRAKDAEIDAKSIEVKLARVEGEVLKLKNSLERARDEALIDPLTGVANRRAYDERLNLEIERWKRKKEPLVVAILDVDHFKRVNDNYGHPVGDKVLRTISQLLNKQIRDSDFFGRIGGEEYAILFSDSTLDNAKVRLEKIRSSVGRCKFGSQGQRVVITMSAGCAEYKEGDDSESFYARADKALLAAKKAGRDRCLTEEDIG